MTKALEQMQTAVVAWPPEDVQRYRASGTWGDRTIPQELSVVAALRGDADAVVTRDETLSYRELAERTDRLAAALIELGLERGERVLLQVDNRADTVVLWYGLLKAGLVPVATLTLHRRHEIDAITEQTQAVAHAVIADDPKFDLVAFARERAAAHNCLRVVITLGGPDDAPGVHPLRQLVQGVEPDVARPLVAARQAEVDPDDVAVFQLSGGTTGTPKVIPRLHAEYWSNARAYGDRLGWDESVRVVHPMPIVHNAGVTCSMHGAHSYGGALVLGAPPEMLDLLVKGAVTDALMTPSTAVMARQSPLWAEVLSTLRTATLSGSKVPAELFEALQADGLQVGQLFGMGEGPFLLTRRDDPAKLRNESVGSPLFPFDHVDILVPGTETPVPDGEVGELCFRGSSTIRGYYAAEEHNRRAFTAAGSLRTGDLGCWQTVDGARGIALEGRIKDLINRGGEKINSEEVEMLLMRHPRVAAAALVPMPDRKLVERACAYLVTRGAPLTMAEVHEHMEGLGVAKYKWPERLEHVEALPTTPVGKVSKVVMRADVAAKIEQEAGEGAPA